MLGQKVSIVLIFYSCVTLCTRNATSSEGFLLKSRRVEHLSYATTLNFADERLVVPDNRRHPFINKRYPDDFGPHFSNAHSSHVAKEVDIIDYVSFQRHYHRSMTLNDNGFEFIDVSAEQSLQNALGEALQQEQLSTENIRSLRKTMMGIFRTLLDNSYLWIYAFFVFQIC